MRANALVVAALVAMSLAAAIPMGSGQIIGGGIGNLAPVIASVDSDDADDVVAPNAGGTRSVVVTAVVTDANGFLDIVGASGVKMALVYGGNDVIAEDVAPRTGGSLLSGTYVRTFSVPYYFAPGTYTIRVEAIDLALATDEDTTYTFTYSTLLAASPGASVSLGSSLSPGATGSIASLAVQNTGNAIMDAQVVAASGLTNATSGVTIPASAVSYGVASDLTGSSTMVTSSPPTLTAFSLAVATSGGPSSGNLYFRITVPAVDDMPSDYLPEGEYTTTLTVSAVANS